MAFSTREPERGDLNVTHLDASEATCRTLLGRIAVHVRDRAWCGVANKLRPQEVNHATAGRPVAILWQPRAAYEQRRVVALYLHERRCFGEFWAATVFAHTRVNR